LILSLTLATVAAEEAPIDTDRLDVVFALDASTYAIDPSGADVDGDGEVATQKLFLGFLPIRPKRSDSVLAAEIRAVRVALDRLDPGTTRVAVVTYAGDAADAGRRGAEVIAPLGPDFGEVRSSLDALARRGPGGLSDLSGGIDLATSELQGKPGQNAEREPRRVMVLLSNGRPTLPRRGEPVTNGSEAVAAAQRAGRAGVRILVYGIGAEISEPLLRQIAEASQGEYTRVENAAEIDVVARVFAAEGTAPEP
jgi:hypothetical protein